jgi:hypothetical protein
MSAVTPKAEVTAFTLTLRSEYPAARNRNEQDG